MQGEVILCLTASSTELGGYFEGLTKFSVQDLAELAGHGKANVRKAVLRLASISEGGSFKISSLALALVTAGEQSMQSLTHSLTAGDLLIITWACSQLHLLVDLRSTL